jgi:predicted HicB family RNase H-like nuclease
MSQRRTIRLPESLHTRLVAAADANQCGVSDVIRQALTRYFDN